jgi:hypothetical protein
MELSTIYRLEICDAYLFWVLNVFNLPVPIPVNKSKLIWITRRHLGFKFPFFSDITFFM